ncbi:MiaB/RimO family radical SAM methylthiotransferase [Patescibacteria group bacterium]|nr:MiaB/RimO family radical SAM methylthiotransferase [Patescibacteria group bacterium]
MKNKKYFIKTYGCQMNVSDSERIVGWYQQNGWQEAKSMREADEVVIVTCSVRQTAEDRVYGLINNIIKLKTKNSKLKIVLTGCMMRYPLKWLKDKMPQVDEFKKIDEFKIDSGEKIVRESKSQAFVPIMEGCNQFCAYCVVPYARGREVSRPFEEIICEVEELSKRGYQEITLLGQNVNSYGKDLKSNNNFARLLKEIHQIEGIKKISFLTSNPWDLSDEIIEAISLPKIDRYLHLPVQSGDDEILERMNRPYRVKDYLQLVEKIRKKIPDIKIGTDIIVGFPGETEKQFKKTVDLCQKVGFVKAYVAMYSPRWGTTAFHLKDDIPLQEKRQRWKILDDLIN